MNRIIEFKKIVIFIDEFDSIPVDELENFLTSLRKLYLKYKKVKEKAKLYKETFVEIMFDHVEYNQYDEEQSWLEQYGLIKNIDGYAVVANKIYKAIHVKAFFKEAKAYDDLSLKTYELQGNRLDMKRDPS